MQKKRVKVKPGSSKNELIVHDDGNWEIKLRAKPVDGEANIQLVNFLAEKLNIAKSKIVIEKGHTTRYKTLVIHEDVINI